MTFDINKLLRWSRRLSFVPRWSVMPTVRQQNVAEHSYHVAIGSIWLIEKHAMKDDQNAKLVVLRLALEHDVDEAAKGDHPSPSKPFSQPNSGTSQHKVIVKVADILEAIAFIHEERLMGNSYGVSQLLHDLHTRLHPWWSAFEWSGNGKPITSDIVRDYLKQAVPGRDVNNPAPHPAMEGDA